MWAYNNLENVDYVLEKLRQSYSENDSDLVVSSDGGEDYSNVCKKYNAIKYIHGEKSHGYCEKSLETGKYGWSKNEAKLWLDRLYEACKVIKNDYVMIMEEDVLVKERFSFPTYDIIMIPNIKNPIGPDGMEWVKTRGGRTDYPYYSAGGGSIINRKKFIQAYENHIESFYECYDEIFEKCSAKGFIGWGWCDSIICTMMYAESATISTELPILETGNEEDSAPIIHKFKKYYRK